MSCTGNLVDAMARMAISGGVIVGGKRALKADLAPDDEVDVDGNVDAVSGEAADYQSAESADTFDRSPYRLNVAGNIDDNVRQLAAGFLAHHVQDAFLFDVNGSVGAEFLATSNRSVSLPYR
jgi:hypothetical protein